jgi:hypothetical protein
VTWLESRMKIGRAAPPRTRLRLRAAWSRSS